MQSELEEINNGDRLRTGSPPEFGTAHTDAMPPVKSPMPWALLMVTCFWAITTIGVVLAVNIGGVTSALGASLAVLGLYLASGFTFVVLRRWEMRRMQELVDVLNNTTQRLANLSILDELTSIYNRRYFYWQLDRELDRSRRYNSPFALILFDVDNLKAVNDGLGHLAGDELLRTFGRVLRSNIRSTDMCARIGGDEFAVLAANTNYEMAAILAKRLASIFVETSVNVASVGIAHKARITGSVSWGLAAYSPQDEAGDALDVTDIISWADQDLGARKIEKREAQGAARRVT